MKTFFILLAVIFSLSIYGAEQPLGKVNRLKIIKKSHYGEVANYQAYIETQDDFNKFKSLSGELKGKISLLKKALVKTKNIQKRDQIKNEVENLNFKISKLIKNVQEKFFEKRQKIADKIYKEKIEPIVEKVAKDRQLKLVTSLKNSKIDNSNTQVIDLTDAVINEIKKPI